MTTAEDGGGPHAGALAKCPTGIDGLDEVTNGGLPLGRPTLVCGSAGCGKTLMSMEFLVRGIERFDEPGVFIAFEETPEELAENVRSLGFDLAELIARKKLEVDYIHLERDEIQETGEFDLEGLFVRLGYAIDSIGAKRVVLDTIETLFVGLSDAGILRSEIRRLFRWLKEKGVTAIITGERGDGTLTRNGLEEYVSDCVILLDHRINDQISTRRLRVVKYRGSAHGTNEFPFLIDDDGITVIPITSARLNHPATDERVSTGVGALDRMLGVGYYRGSSVLLSGTAGTGKTSLASSFADATCARGDHCLFFSFEESPDQLLRNMRSIGLDLGRWRDAGLLRVHSSRPTRFGLETHLSLMHKEVQEFRPSVVVVDPISNFLSSGTTPDAEAMLVRMVDFLKSREVTSVFTNLVSGHNGPESEVVGISSIIDTWVLLRDIERDEQRVGSIRILKSRGMWHSKHVLGFRLTARGIEIPEPAGEADAE